MSVNRGHVYVKVLGADADGRPLLDWLAARYTHSPASAWAERIAAGLVLLEGRVARPEEGLRRGMTLVWRRPGWREPEAPVDFEILFEDEDLLAVAKPAGLPTLPGGGFLENTLLHRVRNLDPRATPVHRLGRFTSGIVVLARNRTTRAALSRQWGERAVFKRYRALASGRPRREAFTVEEPIGPVPHPLLGSVHAASAHGKPSRTEVLVIERRGEGFLCDAMPHTGRPHQIRIHLAAAGHPLVGDPLYGAGGVLAPGGWAVPGDAGYLLHAAEVRIDHPRTHRRVTIECPPPAALRRGRADRR